MGLLNAVFGTYSEREVKKLTLFFDNMPGMKLKLQKYKKTNDTNGFIAMECYICRKFQEITV